MLSLPSAVSAVRARQTLPGLLVWNAGGWEGGSIRIKVQTVFVAIDLH